jgi:hypothetical protein
MSERTQAALLSRRVVRKFAPLLYLYLYIEEGGDRGKMQRKRLDEEY